MLIPAPWVADLLPNKLQRHRGFDLITDRRGSQQLCGGDRIELRYCRHSTSWFRHDESWPRDVGASAVRVRKQHQIQTIVFMMSLAECVFKQCCHGAPRIERSHHSAGFQTDRGTKDKRLGGLSRKTLPTVICPAWL
ncbi:hypothetical protein QJS10_CPB11g01916 [Acorus calamus]|uniref:Uncharacterized protein n=1 Tax=Acorus calamus TaxID=4465 RepID=A0AAV9DWV9_ACOCL|nr:hypothetical protein QJS10_CPB11g01916 [Acorus calamus]